MKVIGIVIRFLKGYLQTTPLLKANLVCVYGSFFS